MFCTRPKSLLIFFKDDFLFSIVTQKRKVGTIAPKKFIARLRKEKIEFDNYMQQVKDEMTTTASSVFSTASD